MSGFLSLSAYSEVKVVKNTQTTFCPECPVRQMWEMQEMLGGKNEVKFKKENQ